MIFILKLFLPSKFIKLKINYLAIFNESNYMSRIFLTGATGFIGGFLAQKLFEDRHNLVCLVRKSSNLQWIKDLDCEFCYGLLGQPDSYISALKDCEYVFHLAGVTKAIKSEDYFTGNVLATQKLLETIIKANTNLKRFLFVSSQAAIGPSPTEQPLGEDAAYHPVTDYGRSKMEAEQIVRQNIPNVPVTIIRPPSVYGPRDTDVYHFFRFLKKGINPMVGKADQLVSLVYVEDLVQGIIDAAFSDNTKAQIYFLCEKKPSRWSDVAQISSKILERNYTTIHLPLPLAVGVASIFELSSKITRKPTILNRQKINEIKYQYWTVSSDRARRDFSYQTNFPLEIGIKKTIDWYINHHWL
jgi:dihydroflavonol-4-reductase